MTKPLRTLFAPLATAAGLSAALAAPAAAHGGHPHVDGPGHGLLHLFGGVEQTLAVFALAAVAAGVAVWRVKRRRDAGRTARR